MSAKNTLTKTTEWAGISPAPFKKIPVFMNQMTQAPEKTPQTTAQRMPAKAVPRANILETKESYVLELEMPGVTKDGVEITVENNELTIIGHRTDTELKGEAIYRESRPMDYRRVFDLDPSIDTSHITAKVDQGILMLTLPKAESVKPRKITVTD